MAQVLIRVVEEQEVGKTVEDLLRLEKFQFIKICLPSSRDHKKRVLPSDRILIKAWRSKTRSDKGKERKREG